MKKITRALWALTIIGLTSLSANAQINTIKGKKIKAAVQTPTTQKLSATNYLTVGTITQLPCSTDFEVNFTIANPGETALTSAAINYTIDGFAASYAWEGQLVAGAEETITFTVPNIATGQHMLGAAVSELNGSTEGLPAESYTQAFIIHEVVTTYAPTVTVRIHPDNFPDEISWKLEVAGGGIIAEGSGYDSDPAVVGIITQSVQVAAGQCYVFTIIDEFHDGICCNGNGEGFYEILNSANVAIHTGGPYTESASASFSVTEQPAAVAAYGLNNVKLYPNPATGIIHLEIPSGLSLPDGYTIYNSLGQEVNKGAVSSYNQQINIAGIAGGVYFLKVDSGSATKTIRFIKG